MVEQVLNLRLIHKDNRGEIYLITGDSLKEHEEITLFTTKKGYARGGCIHNKNDEFCLVLEGSIKYFIGKEYPEMMWKGMSTVIPKAQPHYFIAETDCLVAEWGATPSEKKEKHSQFREIVDAHNVKWEQRKEA